MGLFNLLFCVYLVIHMFISIGLTTFNNNQFISKYMSPLVDSNFMAGNHYASEKKSDLIAICSHMEVQYREFYQNLPVCETGLHGREEQDKMIDDDDDDDDQE
uniref:Uncharacterized protein n=1 Tax=Timema poppense TaxID=170557 RepID=A0A7R9CN18_TIMPO|nr:unnamed protein product [Timema poppensis]